MLRTLFNKCSIIQATMPHNRVAHLIVWVYHSQVDTESHHEQVSEGGGGIIFMLKQCRCLGLKVIST